MFDFSWSEIALIAVVVIGPKDLPRALRTAGQWIRKARAVSREFQSTIEQMIREAELDDIKQQIDKAGNFDLNREVERIVDPDGSLGEALKPPEVPHLGALATGDGSGAAVPTPSQPATPNQAAPAPAIAS